VCIVASNLSTNWNSSSVYPRASVVVPCYNEAARLDTELFRQYIAGNMQTRILFVDDGSTDGTASVLENIRAGLECRAEILRASENRGKAEAVRLGITHALNHFEQEVAGYWDADLATPLDSISRFLNLLDSRPDIEMVFGARVKLLGRYVVRRSTRHYLGRVFATVVSQMLRLPIYDTQCGAKLFRVTPNLRKVFAEAFISSWVFDVEIIARYLNLYGNDPVHLERVIFEYPLERWTDVAGSKVGPGDFLTALWDLIKIQRKYLG